MSRLVKIVDNKYVQIEEYKNPNICFNTNEYDNFEDYCTLRETFDPFEKFYENQELKKKYENAVADYEKTMAEKEQLNSLVNSCQEEIRILKKQLEEKENIACNWKDSCLENAGKIEKLENQQKEFIEYLKSEIDRLEKTEFYIDSIQKAAIETHKHNLSKYQEIIGGKDER